MTRSASPRFERPCRIRFAHCDPAGIVFYPQFYVMFQGLIEDWFNEALALPYHQLIGPRRIGLPTVHIETDFRVPCALGDEVILCLQLVKLGTRSFTLRFEVLACDRQVRLASTQVLVTTDLNKHEAIAIPADVREALQCWAPMPSASSHPEGHP